jgi:uncharacterized membrane protein
MESVVILTSLLFFYLKAQIDFEENFIKISNPNSILGFIPLGSKKFNIAINQIASVDSNFNLLLKNLIIGIVEVLISFSLFNSNNTIFLGFILLILGIVTIINSFQVNLRINTTSGQMYFIGAFVFQKVKIDQIENYINQLITNRMNDTNTRKVVENQTNELKLQNAVNTEAIVNAIKETK